MFNPEFDPLRDLEILKHNQMQLVDHIRQQDKLLKDLTDHVIRVGNAVQGLSNEQIRLRQQVEKIAVK